MGFKSDREFLRNISVGAVGTREVVRLLNEGGFNLIDLDRGALSNKIWATKVKRLRVPDLLCLKSGVRIESRAKGQLKLIMSHAVNNPDRSWDHGLRDTDLVACIRCSPIDEVRWRPHNFVNLFKVEHLRATQNLVKQSQMKAASEGSEYFWEWPTIVPNSSGIVTEITPTAINTKLASGRNQPYQLARKHGEQQITLTAHVLKGDIFGDGDRIIASVLPEVVSPVCNYAGQYPFLADLQSAERATAFAAVKGLGFLPALRKLSEPQLTEIGRTHQDRLVRLEAMGTLARLDSQIGWDGLKSFVEQADDDEIRMEAVLLLAELNPARAMPLLEQLAQSNAPSELRSAALWGASGLATTVTPNDFLPCLLETDEDISVHATVALSRVISSANVDQLLDCIGEDNRLSAGIVKAIELSSIRPVESVIDRLNRAKPAVRSWLVFTLCSFGRECCEATIKQKAANLLPQLDFYWKHHKDNWTNRVDVLDRIDFLKAQLPA
ncbi:MAG: HEAT repeat domain-containing protein [Pirellulaceae bacterium]